MMTSYVKRADRLAQETCIAYLTCFLVLVSCSMYWVHVGQIKFTLWPDRRVCKLLNVQNPLDTFPRRRGSCQLVGCGLVSDTANYLSQSETRRQQVVV